jgi:hypothetical protein
MNVIASIAAGAIALVAVAVAVLVMRHTDKAPAKAHPWVKRFAIVLMWAAGAVFAAAGLEGAAQDVTGRVTAWIGGPYAPIIHVAIVIGALLIAVGTLVALIWAPDDQAAFTALAVPLVCGLVTGGVLHEIYAASVAPGTQLVAALNTWLAG